MAYAHITDDLPAEQLRKLDEMLRELSLEEFPAGLPRNRERARRFARDNNAADPQQIMAMMKGSR